MTELRQAMPHQQQALEKFKNSRALPLFMEMRLGKSLVAIRWADQQEGRKLIVAPLSCLNDWERELKREGQTNIQWLHGIKDPSEVDLAEWNLVNYESLRAKEFFQWFDWKVVICDESTRIRNPKAQITKLMQRSYQAPYRAILSGFPAPESPIDFFEQFKFLYGQFLRFDNYWTFRHFFFHQGYSQWDWTPNVGTMTKIKQEVHQKGFVLTRKQAGIGSKKIYERRFVKATGKQKTQYKKITKDFAYQSKQGEVMTKWAPVKFLWMSRVAGGFLPDAKTLLSTTKADELVSILKEDLRGEKVVVWFRFNSELKYVRKRLRNEKILFRSITGQTKIKDRGTKSNEFRESKRVNVMLCQVKCGKYGIDWSQASTAIYYSNAYDMEDRAQSEDRIAHPKKQEPLLYIDFITEGTIDEDVVDILRDKKVKAGYFMKELQSRFLRRINK